MHNVYDLTLDSFKPMLILLIGLCVSKIFLKLFIEISDLYIDLGSIDTLFVFAY